jgi:hypothetical protein
MNGQVKEGESEIDKLNTDIEELTKLKLEKDLMN